MRILEAFDLTGTLRGAAELAGLSDHHTVARCVAARDAGQLVGKMAPRGHVLDPWLEKIEEWVERSRGKIRADIAHERLCGRGYTGSERSSRRAVAEAKRRRKLAHGRVTGPGSRSPGNGSNTTSATVRGWRGGWSCSSAPGWPGAGFGGAADLGQEPAQRGRLHRHHTAPAGGVPTYALTDNEKTVSLDHVAGIAIRNPEMVAGIVRLWSDPGHLCGGGPQVEGRLGGDGPDCQGRPGPDRRQPAR